MAAQVETQNQLGEVLAILRRRRLLILLPAAYVIVLGVVLANFLPRKYTAEMQVNLLETRLDEGASQTTAAQASPQREIENAVAQITQQGRIEDIIQEQGWTDYLALDAGDRFDFVQRVQRNISIFVLPKAKERGSTFVDIGYSDTDRRRATEFLTALAERWVVEVFERDLANLAREMQVLEEQRDTLRRELATLEGKESQLLKQGNLSITDSPSNTSREQDPVFKRKVENERERDRVTLDLADLRTQISELEEELQLEPATIPLDAGQAALQFTQQIAALEAQIQGVQLKREGLTPLHRDYKRFTKEIESYQEQIELLREREAQAPSATREVRNARHDQLRDQIKTLQIEAAGLDRRLELLDDQITADESLYQERVNAYQELGEVRREIGAVERDLGKAEEKYSDARYNLGLLEEVYGEPYEITKRAFAPEDPTSPNVPMIVGFAVILGLAIGLGLAFASEFVQPGYRSVYDASRSLAVPVLGVVDEIVTRRTRRRHALRRSVVVLSSVVLLGSLGWFTWAWTNRPELLSTELLEAIEDVRSKLG